MTMRVAIIGAGGTIAMEGAHPFDWVDYGDTGVINPVETIVAGMDFGLPDIEVTLHPFRMLPSTGITPQDWCDLGREIACVAEGEDGTPPDGIVVTHGTASMEETAFFTDLTLAADLPVVFTGAQRPPNTAASDAVANMRQAIAAAAGLEPGAYVAMNGYLYCADDVSKTANHALEAFTAPEFGPLGRIEASGEVLCPRRRRPRPCRFSLPTGEVPRVALVASYAGADGVAIDALTATGVDGIVSMGFAPGRCTPGEREALKRAVAAGVCVVQSSRALRGRVPVQPYNTADGILGGGGLSAVKARILVMLALAEGRSRAEIEACLQCW